MREQRVKIINKDYQSISRKKTKSLIGGLKFPAEKKTIILLYYI